MHVSINANALRIVNEMIERKDELKIKIEKTCRGAKIIDAGVETKGGYLAGKYIAEICLGGLGSVSLNPFNCEGLLLPSIFVSTEYPAIALLGSQCASWRIKVGEYFALGSGPARALALKPKNLYYEINYNDQTDVAVIVLESNQKPSDEVVNYIAEECKVPHENVYAIVTPTSSIAGSTQIAARIAENGLYRLYRLNLDPKKVLYACGYAPIAPIHPKFDEAMGRTNDMLIYGGMTFFVVDFDNDEDLKRIVEKASSVGSKDYGKPFAEIFKEADSNFYKIDPALFSPAVITVNNIKTGSTFTSGNINANILKQSIGLSGLLIDSSGVDRNS
ncbi:MAG: methenyltetrahydromethanopterin cyclohydrolase [Candidatus Bathyarchaeia archaeon]